MSTKLGFIAQEVESIIPETVFDTKEEEAERLSEEVIARNPEWSIW